MGRAIIGAAFSIVLSCAMAHAEGARVALAIGNSAYKHAGKLLNPANDATDVSNALKRLGFQVTLHKDLEWESMARAVDAFVTSAKGAEVAIFFYAGHGLQHDGGAFILPVDAQLANEYSIKREVFSAQDIITHLGEVASTSIIMLDACRNNPLADNLARSLVSSKRKINIGRGLAVVTASDNSLVVYSAAPGQEAEDGVDRNSPFTRALLMHIETPGVEVEQMLKRVSAEVERATKRRQIPQRLSQLKSEVLLRPGPVFGALPAARDEATERLKEEQARLREDEARRRREAELKQKEDALKKRIEELESSQKHLTKKSELLDKQSVEINKKSEDLNKARDELTKTRKEFEASKASRPLAREPHNSGAQVIGATSPAHRPSAPRPLPTPPKAQEPAAVEIAPTPRPVEHSAPASEDTDRKSLSAPLP